MDFDEPPIFEKIKTNDPIVTKQLVVLAVISAIIIGVFGALGYLIVNMKPRVKMSNNETTALLDYLPDPGPIVPGLLRATEEELKEIGLLNDTEPRKEPTPKIIQKIREKLNKANIAQRLSKIDVPGNISLVVIKVFDETDRPKVEIKVQAAADLKDNVQITADGRSRTADSDVEIHVKKNETVVVSNKPTNSNDNKGTHIKTIERF